MYATIQPGQPLTLLAGARMRWLVALLIGLGTILALPHVAHLPSAHPLSAVPSSSIKAAGPLSVRLAALARMDWAVARRAAAIQALGVPAQGFGSLLIDRAGNPLVYIHLARIDQATLAALADSGARVVHISEQFGIVTAAVSPDKLPAIASVPGVVDIREALAPGAREHGSLGSESATARTTQQAAGPAHPASSRRAMRSCAPRARAHNTGWTAAV